MKNGKVWKPIMRVLMSSSCTNATIERMKLMKTRKEKHKYARIFYLPLIKWRCKPKYLIILQINLKINFCFSIFSYKCFSVWKEFTSDFFLYFMSLKCWNKNLNYLCFQIASQFSMKLDQFKESFQLQKFLYDYFNK